MGFAPNHTGGAYSAPPNLLVVFRGLHLTVGGKGMGRRGMERRGGRGGTGREIKGRKWKLGPPPWG